MGAAPPKDVRELCEYLVLGLVDDPEAVQVTVEMTDDAIVLRIVVAPDDRGKVIGRGGHGNLGLTGLWAPDESPEHGGVYPRSPVRGEPRRGRIVPVVPAPTP